MGHNVYTIDPGFPFSDYFIQGLYERFDGDEQLISKSLILLPTRRACRSVREGFVKRNKGRTTLLPRIQPLGDINEDDLFLQSPLVANDLDDGKIPPAIPSIQRQVLLAKAIMKQADFKNKPEQALQLAKTLSLFLDKIYTEDLDIKNLQTLVSGDLAAHWQVTLDFLKILSEVWPEVLKIYGAIDIADRRNRLLRSLCDTWEGSPPDFPVIAAGSTGSIPSTARLLKVICGMKGGHIVLPGLDTNISVQVWEDIEEAHPQAALKNLLQLLSIERASIKDWVSHKNNVSKKEKKTKSGRITLARDLMLPASHLKKWVESKESQDKKKELEGALQNLSLLCTKTPQEEAYNISLLVREALEGKNKTVTIVTPDREIAAYISKYCERWKIYIDDSAGTSLDKTGEGLFLNLILEAINKKLSPISLLALMRSPLCKDILDGDTLDKWEALNLRGPKPPSGIDGLLFRLEKKNNYGPSLSDEDIFTVKRALNELANIFKPLTDILSEDKGSFAGSLKAHIQVAENLSGGKQALWEGEAGDALANYLSDLLNQTKDLNGLNGHDYKAILGEFLSQSVIRSSEGKHPHVSILGQLEARLVDADIVIMAGLNEGIWPSDPGYDPWMSHPMKSDFGLPPTERSVGLAAHDFVQGLCADNVILTYSEKRAGSPALPSRWITRLEAYLEVFDLSLESLEEKLESIKAYTYNLTYNQDIKAAERPMPNPPLNIRPRKLSVTRIEALMQDPYGVYAQYVLGLKVLDQLEKAPDASEKGSVIHEVLEEFIKKYPDKVPDNARNILLDIALDLISKKSDETSYWDFWWPRFAGMADWFVTQESQWRQDGYMPFKLEATGHYQISIANDEHFTLLARADRIDRQGGNNGLAIIDYKTGGTYSPKKMETGQSPQLPLEGLIAASGGFNDVPKTEVGYLGYWVIRGGRSSGETKFIMASNSDVIENAEKGLGQLISHFYDDQTPYICVPISENAPRFNDYEHLSRLQEWSVLDDSDTAAAGGEF